MCDYVDCVQKIVLLCNRSNCYYVYEGNMKEQNKKDTKYFNLKVPVTLIERYKAIQQREGGEQLSGGTRRSRDNV